MPQLTRTYRLDSYVTVVYVYRMQLRNHEGDLTMAMTNAEKQAAFRQRRDARITELEAENERLRNQGGDEEIAELRRKMAQDRQTLDWALEAIKLLKAQNKRLARGESIIPVKVEEPRAKDASLNWTDYGEGFTAVTPAGTYGVIDLARRGSGGFGAFLRPAQGRARLPKSGQALGNFTTLAEAKAVCQEHARTVT
jgi:hypothetical protein